MPTPAKMVAPYCIIGGRTVGEYCLLTEEGKGKGWHGRGDDEGKTHVKEVVGPRELLEHLKEHA